jgi:hypothetical protein
MFVTHTHLSDEAKKFADALKVSITEDVELGEYPIIKCNIGNEGIKIYHLPMDQQYDKVKIDPKVGEFYASTIEEAEEAGFRRAYRWHSVLE